MFSNYNINSFMVKVLEKTKKSVLVEMSEKEYIFFNNVMEFAEGVEEDDFIPKRPLGKEEILNS